MNEHGIDETKEALKFVLGLGNALGTALEDKKFSMSDLPAFMGPMMAAPAAFSGISNVPKEMGDLDDQEKADLMQFAKDEFDLADDKLEGTVEEGLALAVQIYAFVKKLV
jgi:hypothetical protein